jgi:hypothetical protein
VPHSCARCWRIHEAQSVDLDGLISTYEHNRDHFQKMVATAIQGAVAGGQMAINAGSKYMFDFMYPQFTSYIEAGAQAMISSEVLFTPTNFQPSFSFYGLTFSTGTVTLLQESVPTSDGGRIPFAVRYELNLCRDGRPPSEGMDLDAASQALAPKPLPR